MISNEAFISALAIMIPLIGVTVSVIALIVWIIVSYRRRKHEIDCRHKERMAAIEKGLELPTEALPQPATMAPRSRHLLRGLVWLGVGLALNFGRRRWWARLVAGSGGRGRLDRCRHRCRVSHLLSSGRTHDGGPERRTARVRR